MTITTIIVTHQSQATLKEALHTLREVTGEPLLVVDNGSTTNPEPEVKHYEGSLVSLGENKGFAHAANHGAEKASGGILCFLNPDCTMTADVFSQARDALRGSTSACAAPHFTGLNNQVQEGRQPGYTRKKIIADLLETNWAWPGLNKVLQAAPGYHDRSWAWPLGTCLFIRKDLFSRLGGFDTGYFLYMEDVDLGRRLHLEGGEVVSLPGKLEHGFCKGSDVTYDFRLTCLNQSRIHFAKQHFGPLTTALARRLCPTRPSNRNG